MLTARRRQTFRRESHPYHPENILHKSDKYLKSLSTKQIALAIFGFVFVFSILSFVLPQPQSMNDQPNEYKEEQPLNIDTEGHVQIFYYPWYGNPQNDASFIHWNHDILPHWNAETNAKYAIGKEYDPLKDEIGASYYPLLGVYSSADPKIIKSHFAMLSKINISVIIVSWHSPIAISKNLNKAFAEKDKVTAQNLDLLFEIAPIYGIKIAVHLEPYDERTAASTNKDLRLLHEKYGQNEAYFRSAKHKNLPFFYVYDSYKMADDEWKRLLIKGNDEKLCVRESEFDGIFVGLYLNAKESKEHILRSGFDGFYTYFAADGFTEGASAKTQWKRMSEWAMQNDLLFVPSIGPGYNDERVRPWNGQNTKKREKGKYYERAWNVVFEMNESKKQIKYVSITSFNEWHEGTQIEPSIKKMSKNGYKYEDFEDEGGPFSYMQMTHKFVNKLLKQIK